MEQSFSGVLTFFVYGFYHLAWRIAEEKISAFTIELAPGQHRRGVVRFFLLNLGWAPSNQNSEDFVVFAFHFFTLSFMSLALTRESA